MKKLLVLLIVGVLSISSIGHSFANEVLPQEVAGKEEILSPLIEKEKGYRLEVLKEFQDEIHQVNELRMTGLQLRISVIGAKDEILDLYIEASENEEIEKLQSAQEIREKIKLVNEEIQSLRQEIKTARENFRGAIKNKDLDTAKVYIDQAIALKASINAKVEGKILLLQEIITILS